MLEAQNTPKHVDAAVSEFLAKLASIDDYVRPEWELEIKQDIWNKFAINTQSEQSMFDLEISKIRNPSHKHNKN
jgi:hypothetical protein